jgi:hypothetical protein
MAVLDRSAHGKMPPLDTRYVVSFRAKAGAVADEWSREPSLASAKLEQIACFQYLNKRGVVWIKPVNCPFTVGDILA